MKNKVIKTAKLTIIASLVLTVLSFYGCAKAGIGGPSYTVDAAGDGLQVVPVSSSTATGTISGSFDGSKNIMSGVINWAGLSGVPTAIHIHNGGVGKNGYATFVMVNVPKTQTGSMSFSSAFTESQETGVSKNTYYFDIHTSAFPEGEIRGQIIAH